MRRLLSVETGLQLHSCWTCDHTAPICPHLPSVRTSESQDYNHLRGANIQTAELYPPAAVYVPAAENRKYHHKTADCNRKQKQLGEHCSWSSFIQLLHVVQNA